MSKLKICLEKELKKATRSNLITILIEGIVIKGMEVLSILGGSAFLPPRFLSRGCEDIKLFNLRIKNYFLNGIM